MTVLFEVFSTLVLTTMLIYILIRPLLYNHRPSEPKMILTVFMVLLLVVIAVVEVVYAIAQYLITLAKV